MSESVTEFPFFVNAKRLLHRKAQISGAEIRASGGIPGDQVLYLEEHGASSDREVPDTETFNLDRHVQHFYSEKGHRRPTFYVFSVDAKWYESEQSALTGAQLKQKAEAEAKYQLFLEEEGDAPDRLIPDDHTEPLAGSIKRFYLVPPATFGAKCPF